MSDEALNAHLHWLEHCEKEQETDYETWLEGRVALLEAKLLAIECGDCGKTMLTCGCDDVEEG